MTGCVTSMAGAAMTVGAAVITGAAIVTGSAVITGCCTYSTAGAAIVVIIGCCTYSTAGAAIVVIIGCCTNSVIIGCTISVMTGCVVIIGCVAGMASMKVVGATKPDIALHCKLTKMTAKRNQKDKQWAS